VRAFWAERKGHLLSEAFILLLGRTDPSLLSVPMLLICFILITAG
jgi:hypothetical protein